MSLQTYIEHAVSAPESVRPGLLMAAVCSIYLLASVVSFLSYALDKSAAKSGRWRTRESTLHLLALVGGWPGALLAQQVLRHKTRKRSFQVLFWTTTLFNCLVLCWLWYRLG
ncbi:MAG TPA: DUF1294 domain-containing protein [Geomonas sp.]|nr:DUF1294 domain-containing protein [Geomonas sp.]